MKGPVKHRAFVAVRCGAQLLKAPVNCTQPSEMPAVSIAKCVESFQQFMGANMRYFPVHSMCEREAVWYTFESSV